MTRILLTGGTGKTGRRIARRLAELGHDVRLASRGGTSVNPSPHTLFDWHDVSTFEAALAQREAIYLVAPSNNPSSLSAMQPFVDRALAAGIRRFVLLSASSIECNGPMMGAVHAYLARHAPHWTVLRPTWFMQNFSESHHRATIREMGVIYSATGDGLVPFIDAEDIAAVAVEALTRSELAGRDIILTGPKLLSYAEAAKFIGNAIGRPVRHVDLSKHELVKHFEAGGMVRDLAVTLADMDRNIAAGAENRLSLAVENVTGMPPSDFATFAERSRHWWHDPVD